MIIKDPPCYDTSHWKIVPDFALVSPRPVLVFTKATECYPGTPFNSIVDPTFARYFADLQQDGIARGAYHFFRRDYDTVKQARHFVETVRPHINTNDLLALDVEEGNETAVQLLTFLDYVALAYPSNIIMLYSAKILLDPIRMTDAQKQRMKAFPVWTAGYPDYPDLFTSVPAGYVPDQSKYGPVWMWQYSSHGQIGGISGDTDCNWIHPTLYDLISGSVTPPPPTNGEPMRYTARSIYGMALRPFHSQSDAALEYITAGDAISGDELWVAPVNIYDGTRLLNKAGDKWLIVKDIDGVAKTGYVAIVHLGSIYCKLTENPVTPPEPPGLTLTHEIDVYSDGSIKIDGISPE